MLTRRNAQKGDTLIEVLFAVTVFSLVIVSALSIMNQGTAASQRSLEMSLVSQQINNQTEALRFLHESYVTNYQTGYESTNGLTITGPTGEFYTIVRTINDTAAAQASPFANLDSCPTPPSGSFIINTNNGTVDTASTVFTPATTYSKLNYSTTDANVLESASGIWIEGIKAPDVVGDVAQEGTGYIDFHIRACWDAPGLAVPITLGTIVRLYEPRS